MINLGDLTTSQTAHIPLNTFDGNGGSITITDLVAADINIYKDGGVTQRSSANGVTIGIDFDSNTGMHMAHIDLSDDTDAGFYSAGSDYQVSMIGTTVDGQTINAWVGIFSIQNRYMRGTDAAQVNAEVVDVINTDANVELSAMPDETSDLRKMIQAIFQYFILKRTVTSTQEKMYKSNGVDELGTGTISDDGTTFTKGKIS